MKKIVYGEIHAHKFANWSSRPCRSITDHCRFIDYVSLVWSNWLAVTNESDSTVLTMSTKHPMFVISNFRTPNFRQGYNFNLQIFFVLDVPLIEKRYADLSAWNSLPDDLRNTSFSLSVFRSELTSHLFAD